MAVVSEDIDSLGTTLTALEGGLVFHTHCPEHNFYIWGLCMDAHELGSPEPFWTFLVLGRAGAFSLSSLKRTKTKTPGLGGQKQQSHSFDKWLLNWCSGVLQFWDNEVCDRHSSCFQLSELMTKSQVLLSGHLSRGAADWVVASEELAHHHWFCSFATQNWLEFGSQWFAKELLAASRSKVHFSAADSAGRTDGSSIRLENTVLKLAIPQQSTHFFRLCVRVFWHMWWRENVEVSNL